MAKHPKPEPSVRPRSPGPAPRTSRLLSAAGAALVVLLAFAAYFPSLGGGFLIDDNVLLTDNALIKAPDGLSKFWLTTEAVDYWPVTNTTFWLEWRLWGMSSAGYHVTNVALHAATALLLWAVLRRLAIPGAFVAAALFAAHPVNVESVAWIAQRKNLLALLFALLSALAYLESEARGRTRPADGWYGLSLAAFLLAMLSKSSVAIFPIVLLGMVRWLHPLAGRDLARAVPFFLCSAVLVLVGIGFQSRFNAAVEPRAVAERLLGAGAVVWFYLSKALLPVGLSFVYPKWNVRADALDWWLPLLAAVGVTGLLWRLRESPLGRPLLFAWGYFCVSLAPVMGFTDVGFMKHSLVADHYQHLALIGVTALLAAGWSAWKERTARPARWRADAAAVVAVSALALLTWRQSALYADGATLFRATVERNPESSFAHNGLGLALLDAGRTDEAGKEFARALELEPRYFEAHYNRARTLLQAGAVDEAIPYYQEAVRLQPNFAAYHHDLGAALVRVRRTDEAIEQFRQAVRLAPDSAEAHNNLGGALFEAGRADEAVAEYERALLLQPDFPEAHSNLGRAFLKASRFAEAIGHFEKVVRLRPDLAVARNDLGVALANAGRLDEAIAQFREALRLDPGGENARGNLEETLAMQRDAGGAKK